MALLILGILAGRVSPAVVEDIVDVEEGRGEDVAIVWSLRKKLYMSPSPEMVT